MFGRKAFLKGMLSAGALPAISGCRLFDRSVDSRGRSCPYWCTWGTQAETLDVSLAHGDLRFPPDLGKPGARDNLNENVLFGKNGWAHQFDGYRRDMLFMVDDGWDVPYGVKGGSSGLHPFGSLVPNRERFPLLGINASDRDRLFAFARKVEDAGWKGLGVWVACQAFGECNEAPFRFEVLEEDLKRKLDDAAAAGVRYWKVDWGVHDWHVWYRRLMSELKERYYPELIIDHARGFDNALNGQVAAHLHPDDEFRCVGRTGRILGVQEFEPVTREMEEIMSFSDVFRTYDSVNPLTTATMIERAVWELLAAEKSASRVVINTEDEPLIAVGLGIEMTMMRSALRPPERVATPRPRNRRLAEDMRCLVWKRFAPSFGSDTPARVCYSENSIREDWNFVPGQSWFTGDKEKYYYQVAPAVVARGLPLPEVRGEGGSVPFVLASRHPNGALAVSVMPVLGRGQGSVTPPATVALDAYLAPGMPLAVFGCSKEISLRDGAAGCRILARDMVGSEMTDITDACRRGAGWIALPGELLAKIGTERNEGQDDSAPGALIEVACA